jgi:hypothetical protein
VSAGSHGAGGPAGEVAGAAPDVEELVARLGAALHDEVVVDPAAAAEESDRSAVLVEPGSADQPVAVTVELQPESRSVASGPVAGMAGLAGWAGRWWATVSRGPARVRRRGVVGVVLVETLDGVVIRTMVMMFVAHWFLIREWMNPAEIVSVGGPDDAGEVEDHQGGGEGDDDGDGEHGGPVDGGRRFLIVVLFGVCGQFHGVVS